jgi:hypothetical protein
VRASGPNAASIRARTTSTVDADESQRLAVEAAQRVGRLAPPDGAQYFRLDRSGVTPWSRRTARPVGGRGRGHQQVLAADVVVPEPAGIGLGLDDHVASGAVKRSNIIASPGGRTCGARSAW